MTSIDSLNMTLTVVSIVVTIASIGCSIWAFISAKNAKHYKEETLQLKETFDMETLLGRFQTESKYFLDKTRKNDWYKGADINPIISPFKEVLSSFGRLYHLAKNPNNLKDKVHELNSIVETYDKAKYKQKARANELILDIIEILQHEIHNNTKAIIHY
ncbi:MAG: hypothetical protein IIU78_00575 [Alistipes sp.]|nr:hypothetical protein [Alistipes sp.]